MLKPLMFGFAFTIALLASPNAKHDIPTPAFADVAPCPQPAVLVTIAPQDDVVKPQPQTKKKKLQKEKPKKKHHTAHSHHSSIPAHGGSGPTKIPAMVGSLHLTSPPGCG